MGTFGMTAAGFLMPQLTDIQKDINASLQAKFGASVNLSATSVFGQLSSTFAEREAFIWEAMADVYNSQYPPTAFGASLDNVGAINNIQRLGALASTISAVKLFGTPGTPVPTGTQFAITNQPTRIFATNADVTLGTGQNSIQTLSFNSVPDAGTWAITLNGQQTTQLAYNANATAVQLAIRTLPFASGCVVTGDYTVGFTVSFMGAGTGGLMGQPLLLIASTLTTSSVSVSVTPQIMQAGIDQATVDVTATQTGNIVANIGSLTVIVTPITGLDSIANPNASVAGRDVETDIAYRTRRAQELQITGGSTYEAMISKLLALANVTAVVLFENITTVEDANGVPPHGFEAFVEGGDPQAIGNTIFANKPLGIQSFGTNPVVVQDSQGNNHTVYYSVPTEVAVYVTAQIHTDSNYPANGDVLVQQALINYITSLSIGQTLIVSPKLISSLSNIAGIDTVTLFVGKTPNPTTSNNLTFAPNEVAATDPSYIVVTHV